MLSRDPRVALVEEMDGTADPQAQPMALAKEVAVEAVRPRFEIATEAIPGVGTYSYDGSGNITSIGDATSSDRFVYDRLGRLERATLRGAPCRDLDGTSPCGTVKYTYDQYGHILTIVTAPPVSTDPLITQKMGVDKQTNQIDKNDGIANVVGGYDSHGNLIWIGGSTFTYDGLEMMGGNLYDICADNYP